MSSKTKIQVKEITDNNTNVPVNSGQHRIEEIKQEISNCFNTETEMCTVPVLEQENN